MDSYGTDYLKTRQSMISRLREMDDPTWEEFFDKYWKLIYNVAVKAGLGDADAQDVVQDVVTGVCKKIADFKYDPAKTFRGWLLNTTRWRIADKYRSRKPEVTHQIHRSPVDTRNTATLDRMADPEAVDMDQIFEEEWRDHVQERAAEIVKQQVSAKQYQIFDCYVIQGWPVRKVAQTLGVSATQVYLAKHRVTPFMKKAIAQVKTEEEKPVG